MLLKFTGILKFVENFREFSKLTEFAFSIQCDLWSVRYLDDAGAVHRDAVVRVTRELVQCAGSGPVYYRVLGR